MQNKKEPDELHIAFTTEIRGEKFGGKLTFSPEKDFRLSGDEVSFSKNFRTRLSDHLDYIALQIVREFYQKDQLIVLKDYE